MAYVLIYFIVVRLMYRYMHNAIVFTQIQPCVGECFRFAVHLLGRVWRTFVSTYHFGKRISGRYLDGQQSRLPGGGA